MTHLNRAPALASHEPESRRRRWRHMVRKVGVTCAGIVASHGSECWLPMNRNIQPCLGGEEGRFGTPVILSLRFKRYVHCRIPTVRAPLGATAGLRVHRRLWPERTSAVAGKSAPTGGRLIDGPRRTHTSRLPQSIENPEQQSGTTGRSGWRHSTGVLAIGGGGHTTTMPNDPSLPDACWRPRRACSHPAVERVQRHVHQQAKADQMQ